LRVIVSTETKTVKRLLSKLFSALEKNSHNSHDEEDLFGAIRNSITIMEFLGSFLDGSENVMNQSGGLFENEIN